MTENNIEIEARVGDFLSVIPFIPERSSCVHRVSQRTALLAIQEINQQPNCEPDKKANPIFECQAGHQDQAGDNRKNGNQGHELHAESASTAGLTFTQDEYGDGDEHKSKEGADVPQVRQPPTLEHSPSNA